MDQLSEAEVEQLAATHWEQGESVISECELFSLRLTLPMFLYFSKSLRCAFLINE